MTTKNAAETPRKLNMDEKRKLEKLLIDDIDRAISDFSAKRGNGRCTLTDKCLKTPPADVKTQFAKYLRAKQEKEDAESQIVALGFGIRCNYHKDNEPELRMGDSILPKSVRDFDEETRKRTSALTEMKRTYTLKLFAGGEEAQGLFEALGKELKAIIG